LLVILYFPRPENAKEVSDSLRTESLIQNVLSLKSQNQEAGHPTDETHNFVKMSKMVLHKKRGRAKFRASNQLLARQVPAACSPLEVRALWLH